MDNIIIIMLTSSSYSDEYNWLYTEKSPYLLQHKDNPVIVEADRAGLKRKVVKTISLNPL